jgi:hypothetical protein
MANKHDERVDAYIERQADFARPILHQAVECMAEGKKRNWKYEKC